MICRILPSHLCSVDSMMISLLLYAVYILSSDISYMPFTLVHVILLCLYLASASVPVYIYTRRQDHRPKKRPRKERQFTETPMFAENELLSMIMFLICSSSNWSVFPCFFPKTFFTERGRVSRHSRAQEKHGECHCCFS